MADSKATIRLGVEGGGQVVAGLNRVKSELSSIQSTATTVRGALGAIGVGLSVGAIVSEFRNAVGYLADLDDAAESAGASVEKFSRLLGVAAEAGKSIQDVSQYAVQLQRAMLGVEQDTGNAAKAFKALGLNLSDFDDSTDALIAFARALDQYADGANKTQIAIAALGRSGAAALPFLKDLANASDLTARYTAEQAAEAEKLQKAMARLGFEFDQAKVSLLSGLIPALTRAIDEFRSARAAGLGFFDALNTIAVGSKLQQIDMQVDKITKLRNELNSLGTVRRLVDPGAEERLSERLRNEEKYLDILKQQARAQGLLKTQAEYLFGDEGYGPGGKPQAPGVGGKDSAADKARDRAAAEKELAAALAQVLGVQANYVEQLRVIEELRDRGVKRGGISEEEANRALTDLIAKQQSSIELAKQLADAEKERAKFSAEFAKAKAAEAEAREKEIEAAVGERQRLQDEAAEIGLTARQVRELRNERLDEADARRIQRLEAELQQAATLQEAIDISNLIDEIKRLGDARRALSGRQTVEEGRTAARELAEAQIAESQRAADEINRALTDSLFRAAESGKDFFRTLRDALVGMFSNLVLRPIITATLGTISGALGLTGTANAATGGLGSLSSLAGLGGAFGTFGSGFASGLSAWTEGGSVLGLLSQGSALFSGGIISGLATIAGALAPIGLAVAALVALLDRGGGPKSGGQSIVDVLNGTSSSVSPLAADGGRLLFTPDAADLEVSKLTGGVIKALNDTVSKLGGTLKDFTVGLGFDTDPEGSADNRISAFLRANGIDIYSNLDRSVGRDSADLQKGLAQEVVRLTVAGLQAADLPTKIADVFKSLDLESVTEQQLAAALQAAQGLVELSRALDLVGISLDSLSDAAIEAAGGAQAAAQTVAAYYSVTRDASEELADTTRLTSEAFAKLGQQLPTSIQAYRALVEAAPEELKLSLMALAPAIQTIYGSLDDLSDVAKDAAGNVDDLVAALESERDSVQTEMDGLTATFGDLSKTLYELENPLVTVADRFIALGQEITTTVAQVDQILGRAPVSLVDQLSAAVDLRGVLQGARAGVQDTIQSVLVQGFRNRGDLAGGVSFLKGIETSLFAELETTTDPAGVAGKLTQIITDRYALEAELAQQARDIRADALQDEITRLETLQSIAEQITDTLFDLRTGSLSALAPVEQLAVAGDSFASILAAAQAGDVKALQQLSGSGVDFLQESRDFFASGGDYARTWQEVTGALAGVGESLADVPTQLSVAQDSLLSLDKVVDNTGDMATDLGAVSTTLTTLIGNNETGIDGLIRSIQEHITNLEGQRTDLQTEFEANRTRWQGLSLHLTTIDANIAALRNNSDLESAAA